MVTWSIAWKEFRSFVNSPVAYIFLIGFCLLLGGRYFIWGDQQGNFFTQQTAELGIFFSSMPLALAILVPALAMRLWPDELKSGTIELLLTYPLRSWQVVVGKFLAGLLLIATALVLTLVVPWIVAGYGRLDWGPVVGGYLASLLLGGAFLAVGLFFGALCREQVTAFIVTAAICGLLVLMGDTLVNLFIPTAWHDVSNALSFSTRFNDLGRGVVALNDVAFFLSFVVGFLVLNVTVIECRKGR